MPCRHHFPTAARKNKKHFKCQRIFILQESPTFSARGTGTFFLRVGFFFNFNANFFLNSPTNFSVIHILQSLFKASKTMPIVISAKHEFRVWVKVILPKNISFGPFEGDLNSLIQRVQGLEQSPSKFEVSY